MAAASRRTAGKDSRDPKGLYSTLGVSVEADEAEIRKAYRRLALKWHPDKNQDSPEATAEFQKISAAYEVLSDSANRSRYDTTGCVNDDEECGGADFDHFQDLFNAFFMGCHEDLDTEEQVMLDELLRFAGHGAFGRKSRRGKKGRKGRGGGGLAEAQAFMEAMFVSDAPVPACPKGHTLKRRKSDGGYECDACGCDIAEGKRIFDCRKCDYSLCLKCYKAEEEALKEEDVDEDVEQVIEAFCEANVSRVRKGNKSLLSCKLCSATFATMEDAQIHMVEKHPMEIQAALDADLEGEMFGGRGTGVEADHIFLEQLFFADAGPSPAPKGPRRSRKKR